MSFEKVIEHVFKVEGGYVNHPNDRGRATNMGITIGALSRWRGKNCTDEDVKNLTKKEAGQIYHTNYWSKMNLDLVFSEPIQLCLMDQGVNRGPKSAVMQAQGVLIEYGFEISQDGVLGPETANALNRIPAAMFCLRYSQKSIIFYVDLAVANRSQVGFLKGWMNRVRRMQDASLLV